MLAEAMQRIPGNRGFSQRYEFVTLMRHYYGRRGFLLGQLLYNLSIQATNIAAMIVCCQVSRGAKGRRPIARRVATRPLPQVMDSFIAAIFGHSLAVDYGAFPPRLSRL